MTEPIFATSEITLHCIIEDEFPFVPATKLLPGLDEDILGENRAWLRPRALDDQDYLVICVQSYLLRTPHHTILIDSCIGNHKTSPFFPQFHQRSSDRFARALSAAGSSFEEIDFLVCTHLHSDHVGWNTCLQKDKWVPTFPRARYIFAQIEYDRVLAAQQTNPTAMYRESIQPVIAANLVDLVGNDFTIGEYLRFHPTPGHTAGHMAIAIGNGRDEVVIAGDLVHSPLQLRHPHLSAVFDEDPVQSALTRQNFLARYCGTGALLCPSHFPASYIGRIEQDGKGFRCE